MSALHPLKAWRTKAGDFVTRDGAALRQDELAALVGVVPSHLSQIETGSRRPSLNLAARLSAVTGIPIVELASFDREAAQ
jgi:transcriptional regulator with XRE-family HTH domain